MADSREVSISAASVSDQAASKDSLGFDPYVIAIADFLTESETKPPLTLSVEGAWGSGKSSFMKQLEQEIARQSKEKIRSKLREERAKRTESIKELKVVRSRLSQLLTNLKKFTENLVELCKEIFSSPIHDFYDFKEFLGYLVKLLINVSIVLAIFLIGIPRVGLLVLIHFLAALVPLSEEA